MTEQTNSMKRPESDPSFYFPGKPISADEALRKWPFRYKASKTTKVVTLEIPADRYKKDEEEKLQPKNCYDRAVVYESQLSLGDDVFVTSEETKPNYIAKIIQLFEAIDGEPYFRAPWFYRPEDTVIQGLADHIQEKKYYSLQT